MSVTSKEETTDLEPQNIIHVDKKLSEPLYVQIIAGIREGIRGGYLKSGDKMPNERELAKQLGVSVSIVSKALTVLVEEGLVTRRRQHGTVIADIVPGEVARPRTYTIGIIFTNLVSIFMEELIKSIQGVVNDEDSHMFICDCSNELENEIAHVNSLIDKGVDGLIIFPVSRKNGARHEYSHYRRLAQANIPFVLIDRYLKNLETDYVGFDNYRGSLKAVRYLIDCGHTKIGHITKPEDATAIADRLKGYKDALTDAGIGVDRSIIRVHDPLNNELADTLSDMRSKGVTAIFCLTDLIALEAHKKLCEMGVKVPEEMSIVAFGTKGVDLVHPTLTSISDPSYEMGKSAAELLFSKINNKSSDIQHVVLPTELVRGGSVAPPSIKSMPSQITNTHI